MRVLVTGAAGFVGSHLCPLLARQPGWSVVGIGRRPAPLAAGPIQYQQLDLLDAATTIRLLATTRPDVIVHLAAQSSVSASLRAPGPTLTTNIQGQLTLLEGCRATGLDPLILIAGSGEEYGESARHHAPLTEEHPPRPVSPYAVSKVAQALLGWQYHYAHGLRVVRLRLFNQIGPGQRPDFAIPSFARQIARIEAGQQEPVLLVGNLAARRDFLDVRDVARAYLLAIQRARPGAVYNIGSGQAHAVREVLDQLLAHATVPIEVRPDPARYRAADLPLLLADATRFRVATGWRPTIPIAVTAADVLAEWRQRVRDEAGGDGAQGGSS